MSWVDQVVLPAVLAELERLDANRQVIDMVREATGTPRYVLDEEHAAAAVVPVSQEVDE